MKPISTVFLALLFCSYITAKTTFIINLFNKETIEVEVNDGQPLKMTYRNNYTVDLIIDDREPLGPLWEYSIEFTTLEDPLQPYYLLQTNKLTQSIDIATFFGKTLKYDQHNSFTVWNANSDEPLTEAQFKENLKKLHLKDFIVLKEEGLQALY
jgi:hypothetical protein